MPFIKKSFESSLVEIEVQNVRTKGEQRSSLELSAHAGELQNDRFFQQRFEEGIFSSKFDNYRGEYSVYKCIWG